MSKKRSFSLIDYERRLNEQMQGLPYSDGIGNEKRFKYPPLTGWHSGD